MTEQESENLIERLPPSLQQVARVVGIEATLKLEKAFRGTYIYIASVDTIRREVRDVKIRAEYDAGGVTVSHLAVKHHLTERQIYTILSTSLTEPDELPLFRNLTKEADSKI